MLQQFEFNWRKEQITFYHKMPIIMLPFRVKITYTCTAVAQYTEVLKTQELSIFNTENWILQLTPITGTPANSNSSNRVSTWL